MASGDGNGWVQCRCGHRHWGRHGAAGLLLARRSQLGPGAGGAGGRAAGATEVLLQLRAAWSHLGGTWGVPGGAADSHEDARTAALRETFEETGIDPSAVRVLDVLVTADHVDWRYTTVLAELTGAARPRAASAETDAVAWVAVEEVGDRQLHPGLAQAWRQLAPALRTALAAAEREAPERTA